MSTPTDPAALTRLRARLDAYGPDSFVKLSCGENSATYQYSPLLVDCRTLLAECERLREVMQRMSEYLLDKPATSAEVFAGKELAAALAATPEAVGGK